MREIVFDTETTGVSVQQGHRVIEIGAVEIVNKLATGNTFQMFLNPEREIDAGAMRVHGITNEQVADAPFFREVADEFLNFIQDSPLVAHNAQFDMTFMNYELELCGRPPLTNEVVDTLVIARKNLPGGRHSLDALCRRFDIDLSVRTYHGALLDAQLLADVYLELMGGMQGKFGLDIQQKKTDNTTPELQVNTLLSSLNVQRANKAEQEAHAAFIAKIENALWAKLLDN